MPEVFLSYSQKDRALIAPLAARLSELKLDVWFDREISAGERFGAVIRAKLAEAKAVLVCWSPDAVQSEWVDAEADRARELSKYLPVYVVRCPLEPPFNRIHTDDLSGWSGAAGDANWLKLVERLATMIGRPGIAGAAKAVAAGDEATLYGFARRFPDEPLAQEIWARAEARHRERFGAQLAEARALAETHAAEETAAIEEKLAAAQTAFETWLSQEQCGEAKGPGPDPAKMIATAPSAEDTQIRAKLGVLTTQLNEAKARAKDFDAAKAEAKRLAAELAAVRSVKGAHAPRAGARSWAVGGLVAVIALVAGGLADRELSTDGGEAARALQSRLTAATQQAAETQTVVVKLSSDLKAAREQLQDAKKNLDDQTTGVTTDEIKLRDANAALAEAQAKLATMRTDLESARAKDAAAAKALEEMSDSLSASSAQLADAKKALEAEKAAGAAKDQATAENEAAAAAELSAASTKITNLQDQLASANRMLATASQPLNKDKTICPGQVVFYDLFLKKNSDWNDQRSSGFFSYDNKKGALYMHVIPNGSWVPSKMNRIERDFAGNDNFDICVTINVADDNKIVNAGVIFWGDDEEYYAATVIPSANSVNLNKKNVTNDELESIVSTIDTLKLNNSGQYLLRVEIRGGLVNVLIDGEVQLTKDFGVRPPGTKIGLMGTADTNADIEFRYFAVTK